MRDIKILSHLLKYRSLALLLSKILAYKAGKLSTDVFC